MVMELSKQVRTVIAEGLLVVQAIHAVMERLVNSRQMPCVIQAMKIAVPPHVSSHQMVPSVEQPQESAILRRYAVEQRPHVRWTLMLPMVSR